MHTTQSPTTLGITEARVQLPELVRRFRDAPDAAPVPIGPHRSPVAYLVGRPGTPSETRTAPLLDELRRLAPVIRSLARAHQIERVAVFGSVARGEETPESDVDLLIDPGEHTGYFEFADFAIDMETLLQRPVDVLSRRALIPGTSDDRITAEAVPM